MLSLLIQDGNLTIKNIEKNQLVKISEWLNGDNNQYRYAMGLDRPITIDDLHENYLEVLINTQEFFLSINQGDRFIGFIKGRTDYRDQGEVWIMSMLIDMPYQSRGIGKRILSLLMREFNNRLGINNFYACIVNDNIGAKSFWEKNGFNMHRLTKGYFTINKKSYDLIILHKQLRGNTYNGFKQKMGVVAK